MSHYPANAEPRDVPWDKKVGGYSPHEYFNAESAEDWLGNRFHVGGPVLYAIGAGRGQMLALGKVLAIRYYIRYTIEYLNPDTEEWGLSAGRTWIDNKMIDPGWESRKIPYDEVEVQVFTATSSGHWGGEKRTRPAWVNPMNVTAIEVNMAYAMDKKVHDADI